MVEYIRQVSGCSDFPGGIEGVLFNMDRTLAGSDTAVEHAWRSGRAAGSLVAALKGLPGDAGITDPRELTALLSGARTRREGR
jgi:hypothetical protein